MLLSSFTAAELFLLRLGVIYCFLCNNGSYFHLQCKLTPPWAQTLLLWGVVVLLVMWHTQQIVTHIERDFPVFYLECLLTVKIMK